MICHDNNGFHGGTLASKLEKGHDILAQDIAKRLSALLALLSHPDISPNTERCLFGEYWTSLPDPNAPELPGASHHSDKYHLERVQKMDNLKTDITNNANLPGSCLSIIALLCFRDGGAK